MPNKMLIDASHPEETRVVVTHGNRIEEFDFESQDKKQLRGNIYLARVTRVEPSLQAAFVEYGGNRHGFLAFSEIHPDYYQIPLADRQALLRADAEAAEAEEQEEEEERSGGRRRRGRNNNGKNRNRDEAKTASAENGNDSGDSASSEAGDSLAEIEPFESTSFLSNSFSAAALAEGLENDAAADKQSDEAGADEAPVVQSQDDAASDHNSTDEAPEATGSDKDDDASNNGSGSAMPASIEGEVISEDVTEASHEDNHGAGSSKHSVADDHESGDDDSDHDDSEHEVESVGAEDAIEEAQPRRRANRRQYKIQEVIKRRQILLVQVVKEERGNKGAALTTYLSLAGRYSVLMPNTARGGGISRKITNIQDRKRLKDVVKELEVPQGMGVILRTAGESRTKAEIRRDYEYLMRMWENVRSLTLQSTAPALVYEEGSLIKRSVRDLYNKEIDEIQVAGEEGYREAKEFMRMLMPSHAKVVQPYRDTVQIFARNGIEAQLDRMLQPQVNLKSGGYIIINQTEALVAIDVNSGRSTKEHSIEDTALQTNLEAADEVARQLRLRDLAGLIVVDFIDMEENRNNRAVEKRMKDALKNDRARIQVGRISHFGLLEMSRQRMRASVLESTTQTCPHCGGTGHIRSESSVGLHVIRGIEEYLLKDNRSHITVRTPVSTALYVLNHKRSTLVEMEKRFGVTITMEADESLGTQHYAITKGAPVENPVIIAPPSFEPVADDLDDEPMQPFDEEAEDEIVEHEAESRDDSAPKDSEGESEGDRKRRRRRRRRGGRDRDGEHAVSPAVTGDHDLASNADEAPSSSEDAENGAEPVEADGESEGDQKKRRRGKRGGRRNRREDGEATEADAEDAPAVAADDAEHSAFTGVTAEAVAGIDPEGEVPSTGDSETSGETAVEASAPVDEVRSGDVAEATAVVEAPVAEEAPAPAKRPRARRSKKAIAAEQAAAAEQVEAVAPESVEANAIGDAPAPVAAPTPAPAPAPEAPVVQEEVAAAPKEEPAAAPAVEAEAQAEEAPQDEPERPSRRRATASETPAEPVVTSTGAQGGNEEKAAPRKGGWWQRKSFF